MSKEETFSKLSHLLDALHLCTGIKFALMDEEGREIYSSSFRSPLCQLVLDHETGHALCTACDREAVSKARKTKYKGKYLCHAGLYEFVLPVVEEGRVTATILFGQLLDDAPMEEQWERVSSCLKWHPDQDAIHQAFLQLKRISPPQMRACMEVVQACVSEAHIRSIEERVSRDDEAVLENYISTHYAQPIRVEDLCHLLNMSRSKLYRLCQEHFQQTPIQMINNRRMLVAQELLATTKEPIGVIAQSVGISDVNYFIKLFRKCMHTTPTLYRQRMRGRKA